MRGTRAEPVPVIPLPVRDHLRCVSIEWAPPRQVADCDALEESLRQSAAGEGVVK